MYLCHLEGLKLIVIHLVLQMVRAHYYKSLQKTETMELFMSYYKHSWVNLSKPIVYSYKETVRKRFYTESLTFQNTEKCTSSLYLAGYVDTQSYTCQ